MILNKKIIPIVDHRILTEYEEVLSRDKFKFDGFTIKRTMEMMKNTGIFIVTPKELIEIIAEENHE